MAKIKDVITKVETKVKSFVETIEADMKHVNSTFLEFPTDIHNLTGGLKSEMIKLASRINGAEDKYKVYKATLEVLMKHIDARFVEAANKIKTDVEAAKAKVEAKVKAEETKVETAVNDLKK